MVKHSRQGTWFLFYIVCLGCCQSLAAQTVEIRLISQPITMPAGTVRISDIAELSGGDYRLRRQLGSLDLDDLNLRQPHLEIESERIRYRAILAGISDSDFRLTGDSISVHLFDRNQVTAIITKGVHRDIVSTWQIDDDDLEVTLLSPVETTLLRSGIDLQSLQVATELPNEVPLGQRHLRLQFRDHFGGSLNTTLVFKIAYYRELVMVKEGKRRGQVLEHDDLEVVRRPITESGVRYATFDQAVGQTAQQDLKPFTVVDARAIKSEASVLHRSNPSDQPALTAQLPTPTRPQGFQPYDIRRNETVNLIIRQSGLSVTLQNAKAAKNGRIGETMEFINPATNKRIQAKLIDQNTAVRDSGS